MGVNLVQHGGKRDDDGGSGGGGSKREDTDTSGSQTPTTRDPSPPSSSSSSAKRAEDGDSHDPIVKRYAGMDSLGLAGDARLPGDSPYTPPGGDEDDDEPYDPAAEPYDAGAAVAGGNGGEVDDAERSRSSTNDLMKKLAQMKNPVEMTSSILSSLSDSSATLEEQKELLRELSHKVEEQKRHIEMRQLSECAASAATATAASRAPPDEAAAAAAPKPHRGAAQPARAP
ncbi:PREDICTED: uncharacterized protein LOC106816574 [Priapulus caudatus]|uniref:Uncharacterized protein LOC106816574 n=1 Tax=Priapulus caudatus TaxID=37621 RepID=A0ABM1EWW4_PRICU|nr:PREDICTED: uncharacterized protein LOC106816574 [Priapulus caudatus]